MAIDLITYLLAIYIIVFKTINAKRSYLNTLIVFTTFVYLVAQGTWFSAYANGDVWGKWWADYIWFIFNTLVMIIFIWKVETKNGNGKF